MAQLGAHFCVAKSINLGSSPRAALGLKKLKLKFGPRLLRQVSAKLKLSEKAYIGSRTFLFEYEL